ncbi:MAG: hypothetical protein ACRDT4_03380 [Micromonosporaceae bacterium]
MPQRLYDLADILDRLPLAKVGADHLMAALFGDVPRVEFPRGSAGLVLCAHVESHGWLVVECSETSAQEMWRVETARWASVAEAKRLEAIRSLRKEDGR